MAKHIVWLHTPKRIEVTNADYVFEVLRNGERSGKLKISKGGLVFMPKYKKKGKSYSRKRIGWSEFADFALNRGRK